jgi:hypothetical protein
MSQRKPAQCTCGDAGRCGYCPRIAVVATLEAQPYTSPAWAELARLRAGFGGTR